MTIKQFLQGYRTAGTEIESIALSIEDLRNSAMYKSLNASGMPGGKKLHGLETYAARLDGAEKRLRDAIKRCQKARKDIEAVIDAVPDGRKRALLRYRYIALLKWDVIAARMTYEERQIYRLHNQALKAAEEAAQRMGKI